MAEKRYIHIRNWDRFQHADTTRGQSGVIPWIKSYTGQLGDEDYLALTWADRGLLESIRLQYAANRRRGLTDSTASLARLFGQRVLRVQLERLNHAGFIEFSASKTLAPCLQSASLDVDVDVDVDVDKDKDPSVQPVTRPQQNGRTDGQVFDYQNILQDMPL